MLGVEALMFPIRCSPKDCFHATVCTGGQGLHPAHNDTMYEQIPREQRTQVKACTSQASSYFPGATLSAASGPGGREGLRCLTCPRALACRHQPAPCLCQQALASAQCRGLQRLLDQEKVMSPHVRTGPKTKPNLRAH